MERPINNNIMLHVKQTTTTIADTVSTLSAIHKAIGEYTLDQLVGTFKIELHITKIEEQ